MSYPHNGSDYFTDAKHEISGMAKQGLRYPSTKPVLTGAAVGAVTGTILPFATLSLGLFVGAGFMFYRRLRR